MKSKPTLTDNQKRGRFAKRKGRRFEQEVVKILKSWGVETAKRTGFIQSQVSTAGIADVICHQNGVELHYECKDRESLPEWLWDYLGAHDALWLHKGHHPILIVLPLEEYHRLLTGG